MKQERRPITAANKANDFMNDYALKPLTKCLRAPWTNWIFISAKIFGLFLVFYFVAALIIPAQNENFINRHKLLAAGPGVTFPVDLSHEANERKLRNGITILKEGAVLESSGGWKWYMLYSDGWIRVSAHCCCSKPYEAWVRVNDGEPVAEHGEYLGLKLLHKETYKSMWMAEKERSEWKTALNNWISRSKIQKAVLNKDGHLSTWNITLKILKDTGIKKVFFITDVHGCVDVLKKKMKEKELIDKYGKWIAKDTLFIFGGNIMDRGPKSEETIEYMKELYEEVTQKPNAFNSLFLLIYGNHDVVYLEKWWNQRDLRSWIEDNGAIRVDGKITNYGTITEFLVGKSETCGNYEWMNNAFSRTGDYGKWLRNAGSVSLLIGDNMLIVHAGFGPRFLRIPVMTAAGITGRVGLNKMNIAFRDYLTGGWYTWKSRVVTAIFCDRFGPLWSRHWKKGNRDARPSDDLDGIKSHFEIDEENWWMLIGHNPDVSDCEADFDGRLIR